MMGEKMRGARGILMTLLLFTVSTFLVVPVNAHETAVPMTRPTALAFIHDSVQKLTENGETYQSYIDEAADFLPEDSVTVLNEVLFIAQLDDISPEEKGDALIEIAQSNCLTYAQLWIVGLILDYFSFLGTLASLLTDIGVLGVFLCLFGLL